MYVLGINEALGASAAILKDGRIVAAALEERFTRIKNHWGYPKRAIKFCCEYAGVNPLELALVVLTYEDPYPHFTSKRAAERPDSAPFILRSMRDSAPSLEYRFPLLNQLTDFGRHLFYRYYQPQNKQRQYNEISHELGIPAENIISMFHHLAHAYTAYYSNPKKQNPTLVLTCDGAGDHLSSACYLVLHPGEFKRIAATPHVHSLGLFYSSVTSFLGLKAHEDEHKVMGLAPYAEGAKWQDIYTLFQSLIWVDGLEFKSRLPARHFDFFLEQHLKRTRFDLIAGATQRFLEDRLVEWVGNAITYTGITNVSFAGGIFLNVKANLEILKRTNVKHAFFLPSPGDDTNAFGACYYGYLNLIHSSTSHPVSHHGGIKITSGNPERNVLPQSLTSLYLGPQFSDAFIRKELNKHGHLIVTKPNNINKVVAQLLLRGDVVARFCGRMEFGARALGNRSILADPRQRELIETINRMIKMRDFWMPFTPTILEEDVSRYFINSKKFDAPYMIVAFDTTPAGQKDLAAAIHPYDKTVRPQVLTRSTNPSYYDLIREFKKLTGVGALLNTSLNIHAEPIVCSPADAISTFKRSGLKYLQLNHFLVTKNHE